MPNKRHHIIDDAEMIPDDMLGGAAHSLRIGLMVNTVINAKPIEAGDIVKLMVEEPEVDMAKCKDDLPVLLDISYGDISVSVLLVHDEEDDRIQCYPFSRANDVNRWLPYEIAFDIVSGKKIEMREVYPMIADMNPDQKFIDHIEALTSIVLSFLHRTQDGSIEITELGTDHSRINKKREKNDKTPLVNDWVINYK